MCCEGHALVGDFGLQVGAAVGAVEPGLGEETPGGLVGGVEEQRIVPVADAVVVAAAVAAAAAGTALPAGTALSGAALLGLEFIGGVGDIAVFVAGHAALHPETVGQREHERCGLALEFDIAGTADAVAERKGIAARADHDADLIGAFAEDERLFVHLEAALGALAVDCRVLLGNEHGTVAGGDLPLELQLGEIVVGLVGLQAEANLKNFGGVALHAEHVAFVEVHADRLVGVRRGQEGIGGGAESGGDEDRGAGKRRFHGERELHGLDSCMD